MYYHNSFLRFQVNLNTILKFETLNEDTQYVLNKIKAPESLIASTQKNSKKNQSKGEASSDVTSEFIGQLDEDLFNSLVEIYRADFEIFGYEIPKYKFILNY